MAKVTNPALTAAQEDLCGSNITAGSYASKVYAIGYQSKVMTTNHHGCLTTTVHEKGCPGLSETARRSAKLRTTASTISVKVRWTPNMSYSSLPRTSSYTFSVSRSIRSKVNSHIAFCLPAFPIRSLSSGSSISL